MAGDDTKVAQDDFLSAEWNAHVTDQKARSYLHTPEQKTGANCSGSDGAAGRVLTLANTRLTKLIMVFVNGLYQHNADVTLSHLAASSTITFTGKLWNADVITAIYFS